MHSRKLMALRSVTLILAWTHSPGGSLNWSLPHVHQWQSNGVSQYTWTFPVESPHIGHCLSLVQNSFEVQLHSNRCLALVSFYLRFHMNRHVGLLGSLSTISISIWIVIRQHCCLWFLPHITILFSCILHSVLKLVQCWCVFKDNLAILVWCLLPPFILVRNQVQNFWQRFRTLDSGFGVGLTTLHCLLLDSSLAHPLFQPYTLSLHTPVLRMLCTPAISSSFSRTSLSSLLALSWFQTQSNTRTLVP